MWSDNEDEKPQKKTMDLDDPVDNQGFQINTKFAQRYEHNQKRNELDVLKAKHGADPEKWDEESYDSENGSEDSDAQLLTSKAEMKFASLLDRIKKKDKTLLDGEDEYFKESDFEESDGDGKKKGKKDKKKTLKDVIREDTLRRIDKGESAGSSDEGTGDDIFTKKGKRKGETVAEEQARLKAEFKTQADNFDEKKSKKKKKRDSTSEASSPDGEAFNSDDDILVKKAKSHDSSDSDAEANDKIIQPK